MSEFLEVLSPSALKDLQNLNNELVKTVANVKNVNENMINIKTPSGSDSAIKALTTAYQKQEKVIQSLQSKLESASAKQQANADKTRLSEIKLQQAREKAFDSYAKQSARELNEVKKVSGLYNQAQIKVRELSEMYNNLAIKKQLGHQLTVREQTQLAKLTNELNIYQSALKKVDADIQKNQRNVGNYASGWNGLGNSINQLSREMPAFANSAQTGFMALSNNLPILFDEIEKIKNQNKDLIAQGQPVKSLFSQIAGSVLSWGTALSVGVTLLTVFGPKIWDMVSGSKATKKALEEEKKVREEKASIEKQAYEQQVKYASDEQAKAKILLETAKNLTVSLTEREKAVKTLQERYPAYLGNLSKEQILAGDTADAEYRLNDALMKRAMFLAVQDKIIEVTKELVDSEMDYVKTNKEAIKTDELYDLSVQKKTASKQKYRLVNEQDLATTKGLEAVVKSGDKTIKNSTTIYNEKTLATRKQLDILYSLLNSYAKYANVVDETNTKEKKGTTNKREDAEAIKMQDEALKGLINRLTALKSALEKQRTEETLSKEQYDEFTKTIDAVQRSIDGLTTGYKDLAESGKSGVNEFLRIYSKRAKEAEVDTKALQKATEDFIGSFNKSFLGDAGLPAMDMFFRLEENGKSVFQNLLEGADTLQEKFQVTFLAISQVAEEAFAFIDKFQQDNYDAQYRRLEQQRDIAIQFAGESTTAQEEINNQYEARRRAIQRKQAQDEKKTAIFKAVINTAQAVVSALPNIPLSIAVGLIGAAQIALISAQQIPQFEKGGIHEGGLMMINDQKGSKYKEIVKTPDGKMQMFNERNKILSAPKGTEIMSATDSEAFMFNNNLNNLLLGNGITMPKVEVSMDTSILGSKIDNLAKTISEKPSFTLIRDARGERIYQRKQAETKQMLNNRLNIQTYDV